MKIPYDPTSSDEQFRIVPGYPGYCVGNYGTVLSCRRRGPNPSFLSSWFVMKPSIYKEDYLKITLLGDTWYLHRLVAFVWIGPCPENMEVCHFPDPNKFNNRLDNLKYETCKSNMSHKVIHQTSANGSKNGNSVLTELEVIEIKDKLQKSVSRKQIAKEFNVSVSTIDDISLNRTWAHIQCESKG